MNPLTASTLLDQMDRELWLVTACAGSHRGGLIATCVSNISLVPELPRVIVGLARHHHTWDLVEASGAFALHLLSEEHLPWVWRFGLQSGRELNKFDGLETHLGASGSPVLADALGWLDCQIEDQLDTGDRTVYLAAVIGAQSLRSDPPLTFKRLLQLAPAEKLQELQTQRLRDSAIDAVAIQRWRQQKGHPLKIMAP
jgi:flavin reductase (DIM6/NTAB) family NADH-FMN oxidoreductase RutF